MNASAAETVLIDYGSGNLHSAGKALERASRETGAGAPVVVTSDPDVVRRAGRIVLPGVGAYADCRAGLDGVPGLVEALTEAVRERGRPFLGICVGLQLMASRGLEHGVTQGLGWIPGDVVKLVPDDARLKIPHMGWNGLDMVRPHPLLEGIPTGAGGLDAYFVHSYHLEAAAPDDVVATTPYGQAVTAMVARDNVAGTQFHPEKSQRLGLALLANFLKWAP
ncbi:imidazole glycerol phosphate synthase subunit HisH [Ancylobacter terrae]|uniref:imidazole glycerol phosphate synthase subunit HisH n=1 Tax=Ancylobacter sp. sgz301288 TaxID=3342077 RepID=UPI00385C39CB